MRKRMTKKTQKAELTVLSDEEKELLKLKLLSLQDDERQPLSVRVVAGLIKAFVPSRGGVGEK